MKILYFYQHFVLPEKNGITRTYEFAKRLSQFGHEVHLIASDESLSSIKPATYRTQRDGIQIHWLPIPYHNRMSFLRRIRAFTQFIFKALREAWTLPSDVIYVSSPPLTAILPAVFISRLKKIPMVLEVRDLWPELPIAFGALRDPLSIFLARLIERCAYRNSSHVVALSPGIQRAVICRGVNPKHTSMLPNSCDIEFFRNTPKTGFVLPPQISPKDNVVLYPGTLGVANGTSYIVKLAQETLKTTDTIKYLIVGDGKEKQEVLDLARKVGVLNKNLFFLEPVPKQDIPALYFRSQLILNTLVDKRPLWNSSPNKFFDALAASKPVAINFQGWLAELIETHEIGLVMPPDDFEKASAQLIERLSLPLWSEKAGRKAFQVGLKYFDRNQIADNLNRVLLEVVGNKNEHQATLRKVSR